MGAKSGLALKFLQWFLRGVEFCCAALILGVYSYFLAALHNHNLHIDTDVRAVTGIAGAAVLYTLIGLLLLCCCAGLTFASLVAIVLDLAFAGAFIYVAVANRHGASSCRGYLDTPFGNGRAGDTVNGSNGFTSLPSFRTACRLQSACLAVSIVAIFFFLFSILAEVALVRHHRKEKRFGPSPQNNYTSGYGHEKRAGGFMSRVFRRRGKGSIAEDENALPAHPQPSDNRQSYATETTAVNPPYAHDTNAAYPAPYSAGTTNTAAHKYDYPQHGTVEDGYSGRYGDHQPAVAQLPSNPPAHQPYGDGVYDRY
jgi:hypothetical protein